MAVFQPRFVDLVRNYSVTTGTGAFVLGAAVNGYSSFAAALQPGDQFYYSAIGIDKPIEREVGRGTLNADGTISRDPVSGTPTNFSGGIKSLSLIAAAEWFNTMQAGGSSGSGGGGTAAAASRSALAAVAQRQFPMVLGEAGREGLFLFDSSNLAAMVAADPNQAIYVAPTSDPSGATGAWVRQFDGAVHASWSGFAEGTAGNAARLESLISLVDPARGQWIVLPFGKVTMDRRVVVQKPCRIEGRGMGSGNSGGSVSSGSTLLVFPAGSTGFRITHNATDGGGQQTIIENLRIAAAGTNASLATATYTGSGNNVTLSAGAANFANGEVVAIEGAGPSITIADRTFTLANGATSGTYVHSDGQYRGNAIGYVGQIIDIAGAGLPAGTTITAWGTGTFSLSNAATAGGAGPGGASATIKCPLVAEIASGGGTSSVALDSSSSSSQAATGTPLRHAAAGVVASTQCHLRNVEVMGFQVGLFLHGNTTGGEVADNGSFTNCTFNCTWAGVVAEGFDAQVNSFVHCNFAGCAVGVLDMSLLGNDFFGCHWAFSCALMVPLNSTATKIIGGYLESGSSWLTNVGSSAMFVGTTSMVPGTGMNGLQMSGGAKLVTRHIEAASGQFKRGLVVGQGTNDGGDYCMVFQPGQALPEFITTSGMQIRATNDGARHWWYTLNPQLTEWRLDGGPLALWHNASGIARTTSAGFDLYSGKVFSVNGQQVVGARGAALPADATDLASAIALVNAIKARLKTTGGHGLVAD